MHRSSSLPNLSASVSSAPHDSSASTSHGHVANESSDSLIVFGSTSFGTENAASSAEPRPNTPTETDAEDIQALVLLTVQEHKSEREAGPPLYISNMFFPPRPNPLHPLARKGLELIAEDIIHRLRYHNFKTQKEWKKKEFPLDPIYLTIDLAIKKFDQEITTDPTSFVKWLKEPTRRRPGQVLNKNFIKEAIDDYILASIIPDTLPYFIEENNRYFQTRFSQSPPVIPPAMESAFASGSGLMFNSVEEEQEEDDFTPLERYYSDFNEACGDFRALQLSLNNIFHAHQQELKVLLSPLCPDSKISPFILEILQRLLAQIKAFSSYNFETKAGWTITDLPLLVIHKNINSLLQRQKEGFQLIGTPFKRILAQVHHAGISLDSKNSKEKARLVDFLQLKIRQRLINSIIYTCSWSFVKAVLEKNYEFFKAELRKRGEAVLEPAASQSSAEQSSVHTPQKMTALETAQAEENARLKQHLGELEHQITGQEEEIETLKRQIVVQQEEIERLKSQMAVQQEENERLKSQMAVQQEENETLKRQINAHQTENERLKAHTRTLLGENAELKQKRDKSIRQISGLKDENRSVKQRFNELRCELDRLFTSPPAITPEQHFQIVQKLEEEEKKLRESYDRERHSSLNLAAAQTHIAAIESKLAQVEQQLKTSLVWGAAAEERAGKAEHEAKKALVQTKAAQRQVSEAHKRLNTALARAASAEERVDEAEYEAKGARAQAKAAQRQVSQAHKKLNVVLPQANAAAEKAAEAEHNTQNALALAAAAEQRAATAARKAQKAFALKNFMARCSDEAFERAEFAEQELIRMQEQVYPSGTTAVYQGFPPALPPPHPMYAPMVAGPAVVCYPPAPPSLLPVPYVPVAPMSCFPGGLFPPAPLQLPPFAPGGSMMGMPPQYGYPPGGSLVSPQQPQASISPAEEVVAPPTGDLSSTPYVPQPSNAPT